MTKNIGYVPEPVELEFDESSLDSFMFDHTAILNIPKELEIPGYKFHWCALEVNGQPSKNYDNLYRKGGRSITRQEHPEIANLIIGPSKPGESPEDPIQYNEMRLMKIPEKIYNKIIDFYKSRTEEQKQKANVYNKFSSVGSSFRPFDYSKTESGKSGGALFGE